MASSRPLTANLEDDYVHSHETDEDETLTGNSSQYVRGWKFAKYFFFFVIFLVLVVVVLQIVRLATVAFKSPFSNNLDTELDKRHIKSRLNGFSRPAVRKELSAMHRLGGLSNNASHELAAYLDFHDFARAYEKSYDGIKAKHAAFLNYKKNVSEVNSHNERKNALYKKGVNRFSDMDLEELHKTLLKPIKKPHKQYTESTSLPELQLTAEKTLYYKTVKGNGAEADLLQVNRRVTPDGIDWRNVGIVTTPKDQGSCGSCWAFAAVGAVESLIIQETSKKQLLSEQELLNCEHRCFGCDGGYSDVALHYIMTKGISAADSVPYEAKESSCKVPSGEKYFIRNFVTAVGLDVADKLLVRAPTVVYIAATRDLMSYSGGIFNGDCEFEELNHAVLLVGEGYDAELGKRYWVIKNSWGPSWGENGFFRLERTNKGSDKCGVLAYGFMPYGFDTKPSKMTKTVAGKSS
ncbi:cysteine proteinase [Babesia gibsoni]|uniref:Cysteine proteinase n=1 Tax=Babesia gibsoni TaxID=33632 RepID=A0AAD8PCW9_BABGI|nr:cysteine proteinase [Babesia gibsoni]